MKFNQRGLDAFIDRLGMRYEVDRLLEAGATYEMLADVLYEVLHPASLSKLGATYRSPTIEGQVRKFNLICAYNGICTDKKPIKKAAYDLGFIPPKNAGNEFRLAEERLLYTPSWYDARMWRKDHEIMKSGPAKFRIKKEIYNKTMERIMSQPGIAVSSLSESHT